MPFYAGIGARVTPLPVLELMAEIASILDRAGYTLRTGGAHGADAAFASRARRKVIYVPWSNFNGLRPGVACGDCVVIACGHDPKLQRIAARYHPAWHRCDAPTRALHARNVAQILGHDRRKLSDFVICWTPKAQAGGGTGQALRIAHDHFVAVLDLARPDLANLKAREVVELARTMC